MAKKFRLVVVVVISLFFFFWRTSLLFSPRFGPSSLDVSEGDQVCSQLLGRVENGTSDIFLISMDSICPYCELAKPFEAALEEFANKAGNRTAYLLTDGPSGEALAEQYQDRGRLVIRASFSEMGIHINPTFLRVSSTGAVKAVWIGAFDSDASRQRAWDTLTQENRGRLGNVSSADLAVAAAGKSAVIVGFSSAVLGRYPKAMYYEAREFFDRAKNELDQGRGVILDCQSARSLAACRYFGRGLLQTGFSEVQTIGMPSGRKVCPSNISLSGSPRPE
jgi:hypothetical protein